MKCNETNSNLDQEFAYEEVVANSTYVKPQIHKLEKVSLVTHGSKDLEDDSDTGGFQKTKPAPEDPAISSEPGTNPEPSTRPEYPK